MGIGLLLIVSFVVCFVLERQMTTSKRKATDSVQLRLPTSVVETHYKKAVDI